MMTMTDEDDDDHESRGPVHQVLSYPVKLHLLSRKDKDLDIMAMVKSLSLLVLVVGLAFMVLTTPQMKMRISSTNSIGGGGGDSNSSDTVVQLNSNLSQTLRGQRRWLMKFAKVGHHYYLLSNTLFSTLLH